MNPLSSGEKGPAHQAVMGYSPEEGRKLPSASASRRPPYPPHWAQGQDAQGTEQNVLREGRRMRHT